MKRILVAGATGYLGNYVVKAFKRHGYRVRALSREAGKLEHLRGYLDEEFIGMATDPLSLSGICRDMDVVFSCLGITRQRDNLTYMDVDYGGNRNLLDQARREGVSKFVYVSVLNAGKLKGLKIIQAKERFVHDLTRSGLDYTVICPNGYFSDMLEYLNMARRGRGYLIGGGKYRVNPIHGADLAEVCVSAVPGYEKEVSPGGPDIFSHKEIMQMAFEITGKKPRIINIPIWAKDMLLMLLRALTSQNTYGPLEFLMTVLSMDMIGRPCGTHHLADFFLEHMKTAVIAQ